MAQINLKKEYRDLEMKVLATLREKVTKSSFKSKHMDSKALRVNVFDYTELVVIDDSLTFLDKHGYHHSLFSDCSLEDLIDLIK